MTLAHYLTFFRIFISPIFLLVYLEHDRFGLTLITLPYVLLAMLLISEISDMLDGYFARKYHQVTNLGKILDPMADSIYRISVFLTFTLPPIHIPLILVFVFLYRDSVISALRTICALHGFTLAARTSGKIKAVVQAVASIAVVVMMIPFSHGWISQSTFYTTNVTIVGLAALYSLLSGAEYLYANRHYLYAVLTEKKTEK